MRHALERGSGAVSGSGGTGSAGAGGGAGGAPPLHFDLYIAVDGSDDNDGLTPETGTSGRRRER